jgi:hypothetical protein
VRKTDGTDGTLLVPEKFSLQRSATLFEMTKYTYGFIAIYYYKLISSVERRVATFLSRAFSKGAFLPCYCHYPRWFRHRSVR